MIPECAVRELINIHEGAGREGGGGVKLGGGGMCEC